MNRGDRSNCISGRRRLVGIIGIATGTGTCAGIGALCGRLLT